MDAESSIAYDVGADIKLALVDQRLLTVERRFLFSWTGAAHVRLLADDDVPTDVLSSVSSFLSRAPISCRPHHRINTHRVFGESTKTKILVRDLADTDVHEAARPCCLSRRFNADDGLEL